MGGPQASPPRGDPHFQPGEESCRELRLLVDSVVLAAGTSSFTTGTCRLVVGVVEAEAPMSSSPRRHQSYRLRLWHRRRRALHHGTRPYSQWFTSSHMAQGPWHIQPLRPVKSNTTTHDALRRHVLGWVPRDFIIPLSRVLGAMLFVVTYVIDVRLYLVRSSNYWVIYS